MAAKPARIDTERNYVTVTLCTELPLALTDPHRESKKQDTELLVITSLTIIRFSIFFTSRLSSKFATKSCLNIPPSFCELIVKKYQLLYRPVLTY